MAGYKVGLNKALDGYGKRDDYPPYAIAPWDDRARWRAYMEIINAELDAEADSISKLEE